MEIRQPPTDPTDSVDMGIEVGDADLVNGDAQRPPQPNASAPPAQEFDAFGDNLLDQETRDIFQARIADTTHNGYNSTNIRLIQLLYSKCTAHPSILNPTLMGNPIVAFHIL